MATYKESIGTAVTNVAGDPPAPVTGQVWYNSSTVSFRVSTEVAAGAWATGGTMTRTGDKALALMGTGTQTASIAFVTCLDLVYCSYFVYCFYSLCNVPIVCVMFLQLVYCVL